jgi:hypothetical protein
MRGAVAIALLLALAGCQKSFDERYADAEKKMRDEAASIDRELARKASEAALVPAAGSTGQATVSATPPADPSSR